MITSDEQFDEEEVVTDKRRKPRTIYVKNSDLYAELIKWRDSSPDPKTIPRIPSEKLGEMLLKIATRYMTHPNYIRYSKQIKEDIIGSCCVGMLAALKSYNFEKKNPFAYFTQVCWSCAMTYLAKHYRQLNLSRELFKENIAEQIANGIGVQSGERYLRMLNDLCDSGGASDEMYEDNEKFISSLVGKEITASSIKDEHEEEEF